MNMNKPVINSCISLRYRSSLCSLCYIQAFCAVILPAHQQHHHWSYFHQQRNHINRIYILRCIRLSVTNSNKKTLPVGILGTYCVEERKKCHCYDKIIALDAIRFQKYPLYNFYDMIYRRLFYHFSHFPIWCPNSRPSVKFCMICYPAFVINQSQTILIYTFLLSKFNGAPHYVVCRVGSCTTPWIHLSSRSCFWGRWFNLLPKAASLLSPTHNFSY